MSKIDSNVGMFHIKTVNGLEITLQEFRLIAIKEDTQLIGESLVNYHNNINV